MYRCEDCGHLFENGEQKFINENLGECHGFPVSKMKEVCPICSGNFKTAIPCKICGTYENVEDDFCTSCIKDMQRTVDAFVEKTFSKEEKELFESIYGG
jgi:RecJ-like exonuclease